MGHRARPRRHAAPSRAPRRRSTTAGAVLAAITLIAAMLTGSTATASPGDRLALIPTTKTIAKGTSVSAEILWQVAGVPRTGSVMLQHRINGTWRDARTVQVSNGVGTTNLKPGATKAYRLRAGHQTSMLKTITVQDVLPHPGDRLALIPTTKTIAKGTSVSAEILWQVAGAPRTGSVMLQHRINGTWRDARTVQVSNGVGTTNLKPGATKAYRLRAGHQTSMLKTITVTSPSTFTFRGSGWGHGVGMSQYGAYGMAREGATATAILQHYYTGSQVVPMAADRRIRVQLYNGASTSVSVTGGATRLRQGNTGTPVDVTGRTLTVTPASNGRVTVRAGDITMTTASGVAAVVEWENTSYYAPTSNATAVATVSGANGRFRHGRLVISNINNRVNVVNVLGLNDEYLYGIAEVPSSWPVKALQAQVIAARTYALANISYSAACDCNVYADTRSQVFTGWDKEGQAVYGPRWVEAVDGTIRGGGSTGLVVTHNDRLIATYYFSSSGGATLNSEDVWSAALPYTRSVSDPWSLDAVNPRANWSNQVSQATLRSFFGLSDVASVRVTARYTGGAVRTMVATSSAGRTSTVTAKSERFRTGLGLPSAWITSIS